jgi:aquaporin Z
LHAQLIFFFSISCSGAHFNPAVTLGAAINRRISIGAAILYIFAQTAGAIVGGLLAVAIAGPNNIVIAPDWSTIKVGPAFAVEALFSFALVLVMQNAILEKNTREPNSYFGLAVSFTVLAGASAVNSISGGLFNPAVGTGLQLASLATGNGGSMRNVWIYWLAPFLGSIFATLVKIYMNLESHQQAEGLPLVVPLTEAIGTFFVVLTAALTGEGLAVGAMLLAMVYCGDHGEFLSSRAAESAHHLFGSPYSDFSCWLRVFSL